MKLRIIGNEIKLGFLFSLHDIRRSVFQVSVLLEAQSREYSRRKVGITHTAPYLLFLPLLLFSSFSSVIIISCTSL